MAESYRSGHCRSCGEQRRVSRPKANHVLHLILTIITLGLWAIIWFGVAVQFGGWRCQQCGSKKVTAIS